MGAQAVRAVLAAAGAALAPLALAPAIPPAFGAGGEPVPARAAALTHLVRQDCGSCHGMTMGGGLGPALTRAALADKAPESLVATVLRGRPGTAMPPWDAFVSEAEARWIVRRLMEGTLDER
jgi:cytochrome c55X